MRKIRIVCGMVSLLLLVAATAHIFYPPLNNWKLLLAGERNLYTQFQPLENTDKMQEDFREKTNIHFASFTGPEVLTPTKDIHYYSSPNGLIPAYTLKAGHTYAILYTEGYGFVTWPTYNRDWRYTRPFLEVNKEDYMSTEYMDYEKFSALPDAYIRLSDLEDLLSGEYAILELDNRYPETRPSLYDLDTLMYTSGYCYSPSSAPVFDIWNVAFLLAGLLLLSITLFGMRKSNKTALTQEPIKKFVGEKAT